MSSMKLGLAGLGLAAALLVAPCHGSARTGHENKPAGYSHDLCVRVAWDMETSQNLYTDQAMRMQLHLLGCTSSFAGVKDTSNPCRIAATAAATRINRRDRIAPVAITPAQIGREIGGEGTVVEGGDCTLDASWSWS